MWNSKSIVGVAKRRNHVMGLKLNPYICRLQEHFESGDASDQVLTREVADTINSSLVSVGETQLLPGEIGRLVSVAFGPEIERRRTRILGSQVSVYRGIRRKVTGNQPTAKRLCLETPSVSQEPASLSSQEEGTSSLSHGHGQEADTSSPTTVKLQKQIRQLEAELRHEKQARQEVQNQL